MGINIYLNNGIQSIAKTAARFYLKESKGRKFITGFMLSLHKSAKVREKYENEGVHIPPFLIASVATACNLHCTGCYARAGGVCKDEKLESEMSADNWQKIFDEAVQLGIPFILLAGGEPLMRKDVIKLAAEYKNIVFPVFTNGTLIDDAYMQMFDDYRNLIPVLSLEGDSLETDKRRGIGVHEQIESTMKELQKRHILFGTSITVTTKNKDQVVDKIYADKLRKQGCGVIFYVEYVPVEEGTDDLVLTKEDLVLMDNEVRELKEQFRDMSIVSFPGDEKYMGGCLAAGRGFFHINPMGSAEPCPFSPYSQMNLKTDSMLDVLRSSFFAQVRAIEEREADNHQGGCTLFQHQNEVKAVKGV